MTEYQIIAIHLTPSNNPGHYHIQRVRCRYQDAFSRLYVISDFEREYIADQIDRRMATAFTEVQGSTAAVHVEHLNGRKYLRTVPDATGKDNLLSLDQF